MAGIVYNQKYGGSSERSYTKMWLDDGSFVAYLKRYDVGLASHEIVGHGLAQLLDEYIEPGNEGKEMPEKRRPLTIHALFIL